MSWGFLGEHINQAGCKYGYTVSGHAALTYGEN